MKDLSHLTIPQLLNRVAKCSALMGRYQAMRDDEAASRWEGHAEEARKALLLRIKENS